MYGSLHGIEAGRASMPQFSAITNFDLLFPLLTLTECKRQVFSIASDSVRKVYDTVQVETLHFPLPVMLAQVINNP